MSHDRNARTDRPMQGWEIWDAFCPGNGAMLVAILGALRRVPAAAIAEGIKRIDSETAYGPLMDPTAYMGGHRFKNASDYRRMLEGLLSLRRALQEVAPDDQFPPTEFEP